MSDGGAVDDRASDERWTSTHSSNVSHTNSGQRTISNVNIKPLVAAGICLVPAMSGRR